MPTELLTIDGSLSTQADELAAVVILARNMNARPCRAALAVALGLGLDETSALVDELIGADRIKSHLISRGLDEPTAPWPFEKMARHQLRRNGQVITAAAIANRVAEFEANWPKIEARMAENDAWRADALAIAPRVVALVAKARAATGTAPTWWEIGRVFHWESRREITVRLSYLVRQGWLVSTKEARSTDVGPLGRHYLARLP